MKRQSTQALTTAAILSALAVALSALEGLLPPLPIPGARLGLANLVVMYALSMVSVPCAVGVSAVKVGFALLRGPIACGMSAAGTALSLIVMIVLHRLCAKHISFIGLGVAGALMHNIGQWMASWVILGAAVTYYAPLLILLALPAGLLTGIVLNLTVPYLQKRPFFRKG